ncbi:MAG: nitroreductase family protein [Nitrospirae bacterium]|nr:nitroreductase family protein [Nitrospirota bacterium]
MDTFDLIKTRRSIRKYTDEPVSNEIINKIIEAGTWAPSGLNNQPWKFAIIKDNDLKVKISALTHYSRIIITSNALIAVFLDNAESYDRTKDTQAIGACIQNMLLYIHSIELGSVWLGEILKNKDKFLELIGCSGDLELMAVIALGYPAAEGGKVTRKSPDQTIIFRK